MFTPNLKLYAMPLAILMLSAGIAAPKSVAESTSPRTVTARFIYKANAPVAQIYADFRATRRNAPAARRARAQSASAGWTRNAPPTSSGEFCSA
jgi:hypothetical protein